MECAELRPEKLRSRRYAGFRFRCLLLAALVGGALTLGSPPVPGTKPSLAQASTKAENPLTTLVAAAADERVLTGTVEQHLRAGSYSYLALRLARDGSTQWAVTLGKGAPPGTQVRVRNFGRRKDFHSARLGRTFPDLVFGMVSRLD